MRTAGAGIASVAAIGEAAIQARGFCERRRPPSHHSILSIHFQSPGNSSGVDAQVEPIGQDATAHMVPIADRKYNDVEELKSIIKQQSDDITKLMNITAELTSKLDKVTNENVDMQTHMAGDLAHAQKTMQAEYDNIFISNNLRLEANTDAEIRMLKLQLAKQRSDVDAQTEAQE